MVGLLKFKDHVKHSININLGIYAGVLHDSKDQWIITIGSKQLSLVREIVSPHFESSMLYRIGV